jgi:hypothetical protein
MDPPSPSSFFSPTYLCEINSAFLSGSCHIDDSQPNHLHYLSLSVGHMINCTFDPFVSGCPSPRRSRGSEHEGSMPIDPNHERDRSRAIKCVIFECFSLFHYPHRVHVHVSSGVIYLVANVPLQETLGLHKERVDD